ncbi:MAG: glutathionylspermidine synthase family protein [Alphaproteobacteria bacterium]|nr:glutathionylspermidine synthase family protein [Alphaproteobacteria bacterium]
MPRVDWRRRAEAIGFSFHTGEDKPYWDETACYALTADAVDELEAATNELEQMCLALVDRVIERGDQARLLLSDDAAALVEASWKRGDRNLVGRFDLSWDGEGPAKLLEYNADTPTALFEAAVVQWEWLQTVKPDADQFNSIHERLIEAWRNFGIRNGVHFASVRDHAEDQTTTEYLRDTATQAGLETAFLYIDEIGWNGIGFVDGDERPIRTLFKLYPWEWLMREEFGRHVGPSRVQMIEPAWKMVLSNKAMLPLLWEMAPNHPNLLPAAFEEAAIQGPKVRKPIFGREGANVEIVGGAASDGPYGAEGFVYQALHPLPKTDGGYPVFGSWVVASQAAGLGIREDDGPITRDGSRFVPHYFA